ncbi:MAG: YggS family pyridoxal phosphate-dependent enzyme, partial [Candidatus Methanofastidiosa archaeon]|nr:YggS family pyridoxal phosphate-dependent enzyme [Candidatus Methanofastidiosa archaeon]
NGLMTMGKWSSDTSVIRQCFSKTRALFDEMQKADIPNMEPRYLSMGMSSSYKLAIEEGANLVRIGEGIFGPRT